MRAVPVCSVPPADQFIVDALTKHIDKYMESVLEHKRLHCRELVPCDRLSCVRAFTRLFDSLATPENGVSPEEGPEAYPLLIEVSKRALTKGAGHMQLHLCLQMYHCVYECVYECVCACVVVRSSVAGTSASPVCFFGAMPTSPLPPNFCHTCPCPVPPDVVPVLHHLGHRWATERGWAQEVRRVHA